MAAGVANLCWAAWRWRAVLPTQRAVAAAAGTDGARLGRSRGQIRVTDSLAGQPSLASSALQPTVTTPRKRATPSIDGNFLKSILGTTDLSFRLGMPWVLWNSVKLLLGW